VKTGNFIISTCVRFPASHFQEFSMKALISVFALLSFIAATTVPYVANARLTETTVGQKKEAQKHAKKTSAAKKRAIAAKKRHNAM
jgi:hypothetical protein